MRVKSLENRIHAVVEEAASVIADIVRAELAAEVQKAVAVAQPKSGRWRNAKLKTATAKKGRGRRRGSLNNATLARVLQVIESTPGLRSEQLYQKLPLPREVTKRALAKLREDKRVKTKGDRRAMTYAPA